MTRTFCERGPYIRHGRVNRSVCSPVTSEATRSVLAALRQWFRKIRSRNRNTESARHSDARGRFRAGNKTNPTCLTNDINKSNIFRPIKRQPSRIRVFAPHPPRVPSFLIGLINSWPVRVARSESSGIVQIRIKYTQCVRGAA